VTTCSTALICFAAASVRSLGTAHISPKKRYSCFRVRVPAACLPASRQVSWVVARTNLSEHATNHPADGEDLSARLIKALRDHPEVYAKVQLVALHTMPVRLMRT